MGSDKSKDPQAYGDELPQRQVTLPAFFIGKHEATVVEYKACVKDGVCKPVNPGALNGPDDLPVRYVSWSEALAYCTWLEAQLKSWNGTPSSVADALAGRRDGQAWHVTLPSEAEWEKAARGTDGRIYPWGPGIDATKANYAGAKRGGPTPVGSFPSGASPYGVLDMSGNVYEWTRSLLKPYPYDPRDGREDLKAQGARVVRGGSFYFPKWYVRSAIRFTYDPKDGREDMKAQAARVVRGGSFNYSGRSVRAAFRSGSDPGYRSNDVGFRVVVSRSF